MGHQEVRPSFAGITSLRILDVDPFALAGGLKKPCHVDLPAAAPDANGILEVKFIGGKTPQAPLVNGIEVFRVVQGE